MIEAHNPASGQELCPPRTHDMKNTNWTKILSILLCILAAYAVIAVAAGIVERFVGPFLIVVLAAILAFILNPVVSLIQKATHLFRWMAILITYGMILAIIAVLGFFLTAPLLAQTYSLQEAAKSPQQISQVTTSMTGLK